MGREPAVDRFGQRQHDDRGKGGNDECDSSRCDSRLALNERGQPRNLVGIKPLFELASERFGVVSRYLQSQLLAPCLACSASGSTRDLFVGIAFLIEMPIRTRTIALPENPRLELPV